MMYDHLINNRNAWHFTLTMSSSFDWPSPAIIPKANLEGQARINRWKWQLFEKIFIDKDKIMKVRKKNSEIIYPELK